MRGYLILSWLLGVILLQTMPSFLIAQAQAYPGVPVAPNWPSHEVRALVPPAQGPPLREAPLPGLPPNETLATQRVLDILDFWFGLLPGPGFFPEDKLSIWLAGTPETDRQIRDYFSQDMINAERGDYNSWREFPRGRLALILLLDQFPRHIYRNSPQEFLLDRMARVLVLEGIRKGDDKRLYPIERAFFYLPLEHAEDLDLQDLSVALYRQLVAESPPSIRLPMQGFLQSAIIHQQQIEHFGRFPYRNGILGRESTPEETVFLIQWGRPKNS